MTTCLRRTVLTPRDIELLTWIGRSPLTIAQVLKLSRTFACPFQSESRIRGRLSRLRDAGWVRRYRYATSERGTPADYYKLTLAGHRLLQGASAGAPTKRFFSELGVGRHHHAHALAEVLVHFAHGAFLAGLRMTDIVAENTLRLDLPGQFLFPDGALQLVSSDGQRFNFCLELDCGTETLRSTKDRESIERKIRFYDRYQDSAAERFRVLFVVTRSGERMRRILETANAVVRNPRRSLCYGVLLPELLACVDAVTHPCFLDHRAEPVPLVPTLPRRHQSPDATPPEGASQLVVTE